MLPNMEELQKIEDAIQEEKSLNDFKAQHPEIPLVDINEIEKEIIDISTGGSMDKDRPFNGQSWTDNGVRGTAIVEGLRMRDVRDCFIRAFILSHTYYIPGTLERLEPNATIIDTVNSGVDFSPSAVYDLKDDIDPIAVAQNLTCEIEKFMGIFPNTNIEIAKEEIGFIPQETK